AIAWMILVAPLDVLFGGDHYTVLHRRDNRGMATVRPIQSRREWPSTRVDVAPHQDVPRNGRMTGAVRVHHKVARMVTGPPEVGRVAAPCARLVAKGPRGEANHQLDALESQPIAVAGRAPRRAAGPGPVRRHAVAADVGAIGCAGVDAVVADVHTEPAAGVAMPRQD